MPAKKFIVPFASTGDKTAVPNTLQPDGSVSYAQGFGPDYALDKVANPVTAKDVPRNQTNQLYFDLTDAVGEQQLYGLSLWGSDRAPYPINSRVYHSAKLWRSNIDNNSGTPGVSADWVDVSSPLTQATGDTRYAQRANNLSDMASAATAFNNIKQPASETATGVVELATQAETDAGVSDSVVATPLKMRFGFAISLAANGYIKFPSWMGGLIVQWGSIAGQSIAVTTSTSTSVTFPIAFPVACLNTSVTPQITGVQAAAGIGSTEPTLTGFSLERRNLATSVAQTIAAKWLAIGY